VHLHHQGKLLAFVLDALEVPESHTGYKLAQEFHDMLADHGLEFKVRPL
jgi:hypothetical protein